MKRKLHFILLTLIFTVNAFSQTVAYQAPDISQCGNEVFDLTQQTPIILGNQVTPYYSLTYYTNQSDAVQGTNSITNPTAYVGQQFQIIYARVTNNLGDFGVGSFAISWNFSPQLEMFPDVYACESYSLPPLAVGNYFSGPGGSGQPLNSSDLITASQTIFVYAQSGSCSAERNFTVIIGQSVPLPEFSDVTTCDSYILPALNIGNYYTAPSGSGTVIAAGTAITQSTTIYVYAQIGNCSSETSFNITIGAAPIAPLPAFASCDPDGDGYASFDLNSQITAIASGQPGLTVTFYDSFAAADLGLGNLASPYTNTLQGTQDIYVRIDHATGCYSVAVLTLNAQFCGTISGTVMIDSDMNGCTAADAPGANIQMVAIQGNDVQYTYTDSNGQYVFSEVPLGLTTVYAQVGPQVGNSSPSPGSFIISQTTSNLTGDFCVTPNLPFSDAAVYFAPTSVAKPGFPAYYNLVVYNHGNTVLDGVATLNYDISKLSFVSAIPAASAQSSNTLTFNINGLLPSQVRVFTLRFDVSAPPIVESGTVLTFDASIASVQNDTNTANNSAILNQFVINSFDPNEIYVQQGPYILPTQTNDYLNYTIRFQNTGNAAATTVTLANVLDDKLDWSTFRPVAASHNYVTQRVGKNVTFKFGNINLPSNVSDEQGSQGYITYEVKPIAGLAIGDIISNNADIYFDFNAPVNTNTVTTQLVSLLQVATMESAVFQIYPNPAKDFVNVVLDQGMKNAEIVIFDVQGKTMLRSNHAFVNGQASIDISKIQSGMYFVQVVSEGKSVVKKLIVN